MPTEGQGAIGSLECSAEERKKLARRSATYSCPQCGNTRQLLKVSKNYLIVHVYTDLFTSWVRPSIILCVQLHYKFLQLH